MTTSSRWWFAAFTLAVFLAGTAVGVMLDRAWLLGRRPAAATPVAVFDGRRPRPDAAADRIADVNMARLRNRLGLTASQHEAVRPLVDAWVTSVTNLQMQTREQLLAETQRLEEELAPLLTPEQRERLADARNVLLVPAGRGGRFGGLSEEGRGRGPFRGGPGRPGGPGRE